MKTSVSGKNRLSRAAAKSVPHRSNERFYSARADVKKACEDLRYLLRTSSVHAVMVADFMTAVDRAEHELQEISPDETKATSAVRELGKEVQHLQIAETWVGAADRVLDRLGARAPHALRDEHLWVPTADRLEVDVAVVVDVGDNDANLINMTGQQNRGTAVPFYRGEAVSQHVGLDGGKGGGFGTPDARRCALETGRARRVEEALQEGNRGVRKHMGNIRAIVRV